MASFSDVLMVSGSYFIVMILGFVIVNFLSNGFLYNFLIVKLSRGKKILVRCYDITNTYYSVGKFDSFSLKFKSTGGKIHRIKTIDSKKVQKYLNINLIEVDVANNNVINREFKSIKANNTEDVDVMLKRAIMLGSNSEQIQKIILVIVVVLLIGFIAYVFYTYPQMQALSKLATEGVKGVVQ